MTTLQWLGLALFGGVVLHILRHLPLAAFVEDKQRQHIVFGAIASVFVLWLFRAGIFPGLDVHFLWLTALTLTLGFRWAIIAGAAALLGVTAVGLESWPMLGINGLFGVVAPVACSYLIYMVSFHNIPRHLFVYIFLCAFFPGALMIALKMALLSGYYVLDAHYAWDVVRDNFTVLIPLMLFPEGLLNGMTMTLLVIYRPEWVYTFHDKFYIDKQ